MSRTSFGVAAVALIALVVVSYGPSFAAAGPLYDYVHKPDPSFAWADTGYRETGKGWTGYALNLTSQTWLSTAEVSISVWTHQLMVFVPDTVKNSTIAAIYNTGGENPFGTPPGTSDQEVDLISRLAVDTQTITAIMWQNPNQPLVFAADPKHESRIEDAAVAFTWWEFINNPENPEYIIELPMTKSVVKAMDAVELFAAQQFGYKIEQWLVSGASKRGWATWLVGGVDDRVVGIAPIVMDMLNLEKNLMHMVEAYNGWTFAFGDYYTMNITQYLDTELFKPLAAIIDPLMYKANLTMPKLVIDATGDEFFMPDDDHYWWGQLEGETYRLMVANCEHSFATGLGPLYMSISSFYQSLILDAPRPELSWTIEDGTGNIVVHSNVKPDQAVLRYATSRAEDGGRRDFRLFKGDTAHDPCHTIPLNVFGGKACLNPVFWLGEDLLIEPANGGGFTFTASQTMPPAHEYRGFFVDMYLPGPSEGLTFRMTTQVSIIPQSFPFKSCSGAECHLWLV